MFELLKKRIRGFTEGVKNRVEEKRAGAEETRENAAGPEDVRVDSAEHGDAGGKEPKLEAKIRVKQRIRRAVRGKVRVEERDVNKFLDELELALLEADVEQDAAGEMVAGIKKEIVGVEIARGDDVTAVLKSAIKKLLAGMMETEPVDVMKEVAKKKPYVILFLGPNGAGKSTTISKLTKYMQGMGKEVVWAAADTFRAASIEQLEKHAERLNVRVVKHGYGSDPAAVAFDAVKAAQASGADVVMIDSAGRQETNRNLMEELKKINRVAKADMRIYVGEAFTGQALLNQAKEFDDALGIDGFILTKMDADTKGGTAISLLNRLRKPVLFIGTGQEYADLVEFKPEYVIDRVIC